MKKVVWAGVLAILSIAICCLSLFYVVSVSDEAKNHVEKIKKSVTNDCYDEAISQTQEFKSFWENQHTLLSIIVHHDVLEEIEESVELLGASLENSHTERYADFDLESAKALSRIKNLRDVEIPNISNIL